MYIKTKNSTYELIPYYAAIINCELSNESIFTLNSDLCFEKVIKCLKETPSQSVIEAELSNCSQLILEVTQDCNMRCKYCVHSGGYKNIRGHNRRNMEINVAIRSIDCFFDIISSGLRTNLDNTITIAFFGGEPILEIKKIELIIKLIEGRRKSRECFRKFNIVYRMTTNGTLLNKDVIKIIKKYGIIIDISLDGPSDQHDLFRVFKNGLGSWKLIINNIKGFNDETKEYFRSNGHFICSVHPNHDTTKIDNFFTKQRIIDIDKVIFSAVDMENAIVPFIAEKQSKLSALFLKQLIDQLDSKMSVKYVGDQEKFTGTCFPGGQKLFVNSEGDFRICEKTDMRSPYIGNYRSGYDFNAIRELVIKYNNEILIKQCWECEYWFVCSICYRNCFDENGFIYFDCDRVKNSSKRLLELYLNAKEEEKIDNNWL